MMRRPLCALVCMALLSAAGATAERVTLTVTNPLEVARQNAICVAPVSLLGQTAPGALVGASSMGQKVPVQLDDLDGDGTADELVMVLDLPPGDTSVWVDTERQWDGGDWADARTSWRYDRYAALDTDRMGFGLYGNYAPLHFIGALQWDLYGKRPEAWRLSLDELESIDYHSDNPVAVDMLLVGNTVALGGPLMGDSRPVADDNATHVCRLLCNGPVRAGLEVQVDDWETDAGGLYDATIRYLVYAHHAFIDATFSIDPQRDGPGAFGVGVRRIPNAKAFLASEEEGILGLMGQQEGIIGRTGLGVLFDPERFLRWDMQSGEADGHIVYLSPEPEGGPVTYRTRLVGVWSEGGMADSDSFLGHLHDLADRFHNPVTATR
ncbi:MAG: DUF4861 family protein [Armatimonadota bacterium]|nr:DUF4861 family protein [Armatimonadota bacterium]